jgi:hypothetical protein
MDGIAWLGVRGAIEQMFHTCIIARGEVNDKSKFDGAERKQDIRALRIWLTDKIDLRQAISLPEFIILVCWPE